MIGVEPLLLTIHNATIGSYVQVGFRMWLPPAPFGMMSGLAMGKVHWPSVAKGLQSACALSFLYLIRCALHSAALLKNIPNLARNVKVKETKTEQPRRLSASFVPRKKTRMEMFSEMVDIEEVMHSVTGSKQNTATEVETAKPTSWSLQGVMIQYGLAQTVSAIVGSFGIIPSVATSQAMFSVSPPSITSNCIVRSSISLISSILVKSRTGCPTAGFSPDTDHILFDRFSAYCFRAKNGLLLPFESCLH